MVQSLNGTQKQRLSPSAALSRLTSVQKVSAEFEQFDSLTLRYGFRLGGIGLLIASNTSSESIEHPSVYPIPNTPAWLVGLINMRGNLVPLFDLKRLFDLEDENQEKQTVLILDEGERSIGVYIDGLPQTPDLSRRLHRLPPLPTVLREYAPEAYVKDGVIWLEFDHKGFFHSLAPRVAV